MTHEDVHMDKQTKWEVNCGVLVKPMRGMRGVDAWESEWIWL